RTSPRCWRSRARPTWCTAWSRAWISPMHLPRARRWPVPRWWPSASSPVPRPATSPT
ncbi:hypothetical protein SM139_0324, partial [Stenotrophomonas maltophilia]